MAPDAAALASAIPASVLLPIPGEPPSSTSEPGTSPPPSTRSNSPIPVRSLSPRSEETSRSFTGRGASPAAVARPPPPRLRPGALFSSVLFLRYRDLNQVWDVVSQAGFFLAPVIYPLGILPERFHFYLYLWPPTAVIEFSRDVLVRGVIPTATAHACLAAVVAISVGVGWMVFRRLAPKAAEFL